MLAPMRRAPSSLPLLALFAFAACGDDGKGDEVGTSAETVDGTQTDTADGQTETAESTGTSTADTTTDATSTDTGVAETYCIHQCRTDFDCLIGGMNLGLDCVDNVCSGGSTACTADDSCIALFSGWVTPCTAGGGECDLQGQVCIAGANGGVCATPPSDFIQCATLGFEELEVDDINGNPVVVCAQVRAECDDEGSCFLRCENDNHCPSMAYPVCNVGTGRCECGQDSDCASLGSPQYSVCNGGACGCNADEQCVAGNAGDVCQGSGYCGCSGDEACANVNNPYDGGMISCM